MTYGESVRVAWLVSWRSAIIGGLTGFVVGLAFAIPALLLGVSETATQVLLYCLLLPLGFFLISPWIMRMMMRKRFRGFHLQVVPSRPRDRTRMTYRESLPVVWLLYWRFWVVGTLISGVAILPVLILAFPAFPPAMSISQYSITRYLYGAAVVVIGTSSLVFVAYPLVVRMMMRKQFKGFRLEIRPHQA